MTEHQWYKAGRLRFRWKDGGIVYNCAMCGAGADVSFRSSTTVEQVLAGHEKECPGQPPEGDTDRELLVGNIRYHEEKNGEAPRWKP